MSRGYDRLGIVPFSRHLLRSGDLDPVYLALPKSVEDQDQLGRFLMAYWCFYSVGVACFMSEQKSDFWKWMNVAAVNEQPTPSGSRWARSKERRHFRGTAAVTAVDRLSQRYGERPADILDFLSSGPMDVKSVINRAKSHYLVGDWLSFKMADMMDAVAQCPVTQDDISVFLYDTPRKSILHNWRLQNGFPDNAQPKDEAVVLEKSMEWLGHQLEEYKIPHKPGETLDLFSLETCFCKHHSHLGGHYPLFNDIHEINEGLEPWKSHSSTARTFLHYMPRSHESP